MSNIRGNETEDLPPKKAVDAVTTDAQDQGVILTGPQRDQQVRKFELWAYYVYYIGNSGLGLFNYAPSSYQNLLSLAGHDSITGGECDQGTCLVYFAGRERSVDSVVLISNGIAFAIQVVLFLLIGSYADYGKWRPYILIGFSLASWAISFAWLGFNNPAKWESATVLYILGLICYQGSLSFWTAAAPQLARNTKSVQDAKQSLIDGEISSEEYVKHDEQTRNRVFNMAFAVCSLGELFVLAILVGVLRGINSSASTENNTKALNITVAYAAGVWVACAIPWFFLERHRPGLDLPPGTTYLTIGIKNLIYAVKQIIKLRDTLTYLICYFLLGDVLNTTVTVISILQNTVVSYSTEQLNYLLILGIGTQLIGIYLFWRIQKKWQISTKKMFVAVIFFTILLTGWGMIGNWTDSFGFKSVGEIYAYQAYYGLVVCPWYAYSQTMISEVIPIGKEFLFFSLFSIVGKTSAFIGPFISSAISDAASSKNDLRSENTPFYFLFALGIVSAQLLWFIDVKRSRRDCKAYIEREAKELAAAETSTANE